MVNWYNEDSKQHSRRLESLKRKLQISLLCEVSGKSWDFHEMVEKSISRVISVKGKTSTLSSCVQGARQILRFSRNVRKKFKGYVYFRRQITSHIGSWIHESRAPVCKVHASQIYFGHNHASLINLLQPFTIIHTVQYTLKPLLSRYSQKWGHQGSFICT